jgi:hypothetical protein
MSIFNNNQPTYSETEKQLIQEINSLDLLNVLKTYNNLSFDFVINYILNEKYQKSRKERDITIDTVANYQPHLIPKINEILRKNEIFTLST